MEYRQELGLGTSLKAYLGVDEYDKHQKKLVQNVKYCADNQWQFVNSYYDGDVETAHRFFEHAEEVYDTIYTESGEDVFGPGIQAWGPDAKAFLKDTKFAGEKFKAIVVLYFTAKLYEEAVVEIEFNKQQQDRVLEDLKSIKAEKGI